MGDRVNRDHDADVFAVDVKGGTDRHGVNGVILTFDEFWGVHDAIDGDMEAMVILGGEAEDAECAVVVAIDVFRVGVTQEALDRELSTFDPDLGRIRYGIENHGAAVCRGDDDARIVGCGAWAGIGLEFAIEELVKILELVERLEDFVHVQLVEIDEMFDISGGGWVVVLAALLE